MRAILIVSALIATTFVSGCLVDDNQPAPTTSATGAAMNQTAKPLTLSVTAQDVPPGTTPGKPYGWSPKTFSAKVNDTIEITLKGAATNQLSHNLMIENSPDPNFKGVTGVKADSKSASFVALKAGSYKYYCNVGSGQPTSHRALGMEGTLTIA
jgi:plastocyanin